MTCLFFLYGLQNEQQCPGPACIARAVADGAKGTFPQKIGALASHPIAHEPGMTVQYALPFFLLHPLLIYPKGEFFRQHDRQPTACKTDENLAMDFPDWTDNE